MGARLQKDFHQTDATTYLIDKDGQVIFEIEGYTNFDIGVLSLKILKTLLNHLS